jgi:hypothetical protein
VRATLDEAALETADVDGVAIAADDVSDGRSITTMMHATAAGAYLKDEIRVTGGSLTALGLAAARILAGAARRMLVVAWWRPTADVAGIARATTDPLTGRPLLGRERLAIPDPGGAVASCVVSPADGEGGLLLDGWSLSQSAYPDWLAGTGEPERCLRRLGSDLRRRCGDLTGAALIVPRLDGDAGTSLPWEPLAASLAAEPEPSDQGYLGIADGLGSLARAAERLGGERAVVASTGLPPLLRVEAIAVSRR